MSILFVFLQCKTIAIVEPKDNNPDNRKHYKVFSIQKQYGNHRVNEKARPA
jgi:hypothetical protein